MVKVRHEKEYETVDIEPLYDYFKDLVNFLKDNFGIPKDFEVKVEETDGEVFRCWIDVTPECKIYAKMLYPVRHSIPKVLTKKTEDIVRYVTFKVFHYLGYIAYWYRYKIFNMFFITTPCRCIRMFYELCIKYLRGEITKDKFKELIEKVVLEEHTPHLMAQLDSISQIVFEEFTAMRYAIEEFMRKFPGADDLLKKIIRFELEDINKTLASEPIAKYGMKYQLELPHLAISVELALVCILDNAVFQAFGLSEDISKYKYINIVYEFLKSKIPNLEDRVREVMFEEDFRRKMWLAKRLIEDIFNTLLEHTKRRYVIEYLLVDEFIVPVVDTLWVPMHFDISSIYSSDTPTLDALKHDWKTIILCLDIYE